MTRSYTLTKVHDPITGKMIYNAKCEGYQGTTLSQTVYSDSSGTATFTALSDSDPVDIKVSYSENCYWIRDIFQSYTGLGTTSRTFHVNCFQYPNPTAAWTPTITGAYLAQSLSAKTCWLPLNFLKVGDIITAYNLVGNTVIVGGVALDCKLIQVNKADPLTTTDITNGAMTQITGDGVFDVAVNPNDTTVTTDKQYLLAITATTGAGDNVYVMGAEVTITRL